MKLIGLLPRQSGGKVLSLILLSGFFSFVGFMHFRKPALFLKVVPPWVPFAMPAVLVSGFFEILGGVGLLVPKARRSAGIGLVALLWAVFPANIYMALERDKFAYIPQWVLWLRLPLQFVLMAWVKWCSSPNVTPTTEADSNR